METIKRQYELVSLLIKDINEISEHAEYENVRLSIKNEDWFDVETFLVDMIGNEYITKKFAIILVNKYVSELNRDDLVGVINAL